MGCAMFLRAKDHWNITDEESGRGIFWHTVSGCCFERHQDIGVLFQYGEEINGKGEPQMWPIWSVECPEQSTWIWDELPLPPTDPASQLPCVEASFEACSLYKAPSASSATDNDHDHNDNGVGPPSLHTEVLDDNVWEKRCRAMEQRTAAEADSTGGHEEGSDPRPTNSVLDVDSDEDDSDDAAPLAAKELMPELPSVPTERAKPLACDVELDMFGEPEENSMEAVDGYRH